MAQRSRKRGRRARRPAPRRPTSDAVGRPSSEERNAAVRATLEPLDAGERPWPLVAGALVAAALVIANIVLLIAHTTLKIGSTHVSTASEIPYVIVMSMCIYGLLRARYWAVLGFMVLLLLQILTFSLLLIRASNAVAFAVGIVVVAGGGYLFYKLVRVLSRIQLPRPPGR